MLAAGPAHAQMLMNGAGATFPFPIYSKWFDEHAKVDPSVRVNYQSIGSGGGIRQITERTVDFGASDGPMNDEQLKKLPAELFHIPTVRGADVATYNLPGNPQLRFTGEVLADIFLGRITKWNDDRIKTLNPSSNLPDQPILSGASRGGKRHHLHLGGLSLQGQQGMGAEDAGCPGICRAGLRDSEQDADGAGQESRRQVYRAHHRDDDRCRGGRSEEHAG